MTDFGLRNSAPSIPEWTGLHGCLDSGTLPPVSGHAMPLIDYLKLSYVRNLVCAVRDSRAAIFFDKWGHVLPPQLKPSL